MDNDIINSIDINAKNIRAILVSLEFDTEEKKNMIKIAAKNILDILSSC